MSAFTPGAYDGIPNAAYHADPALGSTTLKTLALPGGPAKWKAAQGVTEHNPAFDLGTATHSILLEDDLSGIVVVDAGSWRTKEAREARTAAYAEDKTPLLAHELTTCEHMAESVRRHPMASKAFTNHIPEQSLFWEEDGLMLKCRPDARIPGLAVDFKTSLTADPSEFGKRAYSLGYYISAAHYSDGIKAVLGEDLPFVFVQVEKEYPYLVSVVQLDKDAMDWGRIQADRAKRIYRECMEKDEWPGYQSFTTVGLPQWALYQLEDLNDE